MESMDSVVKSAVSAKGLQDEKDNSYRYFYLMMTL